MSTIRCSTTTACDDLRTISARRSARPDRDRYWAIFEASRAELGYADYLERCNATGWIAERSTPAADVFIPGRLSVCRPLYPGALEAIRILPVRTDRHPVDGDVVFQPRKIQRSGLWDAVEGRVLIYIHKEQMLDDVDGATRRARYVMVDDKLRLLAAIEQGLGNAADDRSSRVRGITRSTPRPSPAIRRPT